MVDITNFLTDFDFGFIIKILIAAFLFLYCIIVFVILTNIRSLSKVIFVRDANASTIVQNLAIAYFIASLSLFFISLVIL
ncbi:MAG: hypothetical protein HY431_01705 [Candidatus Levybacteria bacterium]|nr:hypothetical protein [Candidatus Levybacteria bacterium]